MSYGDESIDDFLDSVASQKVTPAGGTAGALVGAIGTALCEMVCIHTVGGDEHGDGADELAEVRKDLQSQREFLLELSNRDAEVVDDLFGANRDETDRSVTMKRATGVPLTIAEACLSVLEQAAVVTEKGNRNAAPDAGTGSFFVHSALRASVFTVRTNLNHLSDPAFTEQMETQAADIERSADIAFERVLSNIE
ncbi:cyclodeaminase/cyclohydrolase family protein [Halobium salinum]|uniref:Cyclodeaminase/cyclohydrolase family protein n=1 Tax=Halobium salinum TaxID=1364940 RepID=A0ABD5PIJ7_9EURY|nr:cyclodeaminase/cyclohydrolase family protein [Halobium salinum]